MIHLVRSDENGEYYLKIVARNGRQTWRTSETYKRKSGCMKALNSLYMLIAGNIGKGKKFPFKDHTL